MWWWAAQQNHSLTFTDWNGASPVSLEVFQVWKTILKKIAVNKIHLVHLILHERAVIKNSSCSYSRSQPMEPKAARSKRGNTHNGLAVYYRAHADKHTIRSHSTRQFLAYISLDCGKKLKFNPDKYSSWKLQGPRFKPMLYVRQQCKPLNHGTTLINKW